LDVASRTIASQPGHHTVVVLDSGLSTVALLDFRTPGLIDSDPAELAASLKAARQLPDLAGDDVVFQGLGDTAAPQVELGRPQRASATRPGGCGSAGSGRRPSLRCWPASAFLPTG